jgi:hypothetical protein
MWAGRRWISMLLVVLLGGGAGSCGTVRTTTRQATLGVLDALREPQDPLIEELRRLVAGLIRKSEEQEPHEAVAKVTESVTQGVLEGLRRALTESGLDERLPERLTPALRSVIGGAAGAVFDAISARSADLGALLARISSQAGGAVVRSAIRALAAELRNLLAGEGPGSLTAAFGRMVREAVGSAIGATARELRDLTALFSPAEAVRPVRQALGYITQEVASAGVRGVFAELERQIPGCRAMNGECLLVFARQMSASVAAGISDVIRERSIGWAILALAFVAGLLLAGGVAGVLYWRARRRAAA